MTILPKNLLERISFGAIADQSEDDEIGYDQRSIL